MCWAFCWVVAARKRRSETETEMSRAVLLESLIRSGASGVKAGHHAAVRESFGLLMRVAWLFLPGTGPQRYIRTHRQPDHTNTHTIWSKHTQALTATRNSLPRTNLWKSFKVFLREEVYDLQHLFRWLSKTQLYRKHFSCTCWTQAGKIIWLGQRLNSHNLFIQPNTNYIQYK